MNPDGTQDANAVSLYETSSGLKLVYEAIDGSAGTAGLKITSRCANLSVLVGKITGGSENCVDLNNECGGIIVSCDRYEIRGKYGLSAKTCRNVTFRGHLTGTPSQWHVNLGSASDQSNAIQEGTQLELMADAYPIVVWIGNATRPRLDDPKKYKLIGFGRYGSPARELVMLLWRIAKKLRLA